MSVEVGLKRNAAGSWRKLGWMVLELGTQPLGRQPLTNKKSIGKLIHHTKCMADTQCMRETSKFFEWERAGRQRKPAVKIQGKCKKIRQLSKYKSHKAGH